MITDFSFFTNIFIIMSIPINRIIRTLEESDSFTFNKSSWIKCNTKTESLSSKKSFKLFNE